MAKKFEITKTGVLKSYSGKDAIVVIPEEVKKIAPWVFMNNTKIKKIEMHGNVTEIGEMAFYQCENLESVVVTSKKLKKIGSGAFGKCEKLKELILPEEIAVIEGNPVDECKVLADEDGFLIVFGVLYSYFGDKSDIVIPNTVRVITDSVLRWNEKIEKVVISEGVQSIGEYCFSGCDNLKAVVLPKSLKSIGQCAFSLCKNLEEIDISEELNDIGMKAFSNCPKLVDDNGFLIINNRIFSYTGDSTDIVIPNGVVKIEPFAFCSNCNMRSVTIPNNIEIGNGAFSNCENLAKVILPDGINNIADGMFSQCHSLEDIAIPNGVITIGKGGFHNCHKLTDVIIPSNVKCIGDNAFLGCENLINITLSEGIKEIGCSVFKSCSKITTIRIPSSVDKIGREAFALCSSLEVVEAPIHLKADLGECWLPIDATYYETNHNGIHNESVESEKKCAELNVIRIECENKDLENISKLLVEELARFYMRGTGIDESSFEEVLTEVREDDSICKISIKDNTILASVADGGDAGLSLVWKILNKNKFNDNFDSIACVGEGILKEYPTVDFSVTYQMQTTSESTEKVWTENGEIHSEFVM